MGMLTSLSIVAIAFVMPGWLSLLLLVPPLMILTDSLKMVPTFLSVGNIDFGSYDIIVMIVFLKTVLTKLRINIPIQIKRFHDTIFIYFGIMLLSIFIAALRFEQYIYTGEIVSYLRFMMQVGVFFLLFFSIVNDSDLRRAYYIFNFLGYATGVTLYASIILYRFYGITFLGAAPDYDSHVRYFGPIGDQIGFILPLFCFKEFKSGKLLNTLFFMSAILATGTRGAILTLFVGFLLLIYQKIKNARQFQLSFKHIIFISTMIAILVIVGGTTVSRLNKEQILWTFMERANLMLMGMNVFYENFLLGVGYSGFRFFVPQYSYYGRRFSLDYVSNTTNQYIQVATDAGVIGLIAFFFLIKMFLSILKSAEEDSKLKHLFSSGRIWLISLLIGNQTAVWFNPGSLVSYFLWALLAIATVKIRLNVKGKSALIKT